MKEARIHTSFGEIRITFQTTDELNDALQNLDEQMQILQQIANKITPPSPHTAKPGYEAAYRFAPNGDLELLYVPEHRHVAAALALYAYHPELVSAAEIERVTGIDQVSRLVLTLSQNKKYFRKVDDKYGLSFDGLKLIRERVGAAIMPPVEQEQPGSELIEEQTE